MSDRKSKAELEVDRFLRLLRDKIKERGLSQAKVQARLGWGKSYVSQLLTKQKALRFDQLLEILSVMDVEPGEFFKELYEDDDVLHLPPAVDEADDDERVQRLRELAEVVRCLMNLLVEKKILSPEEVSASTGAAGSEPPGAA